MAARPVAAHVSRQRALNIALECWRPLTPSPNTLCGVEPELLHKRDKEYSRVALGHHGALRSGHDGEQLASDVDNLRPHTRSAFRRASTLLYQPRWPARAIGKTASADRRRTQRCTVYRAMNSSTAVTTFALCNPFPPPSPAEGFRRTDESALGKRKARRRGADPVVHAIADCTRHRTHDPSQQRFSSSRWTRREQCTHVEHCDSLGNVRRGTKFSEKV